MAKIIVTYGVPTAGFASLAPHELICPPAGERFSREALLSLLPTADAVLACTPFDRELITCAKVLKLIVCYGAGSDSIDLAAATERGIMVTNTPDCVTAATAELAIALLLALARRLTELDHAMRTLPPSELFVMGKRMGTSLEGTTLGIVGMGRIGARVADFGRVMGMHVCYAARTPKPVRDALGDKHLSLEELMSQADFISIHCPQTAQTQGMISREMLARMKPTAMLINTARGPIVDEAALLDALRSNRIGGAALDVFTGEPQINPAFLTLEHVLLTPHSGSNTAQTRRLMAEAASERILDVLNGRIPKNLLNPSVLKKT
ncbi:MAG: NAD(P)-dependent oxidoreductase [Clostridia bacterium]